jgi:hypothetical protein
VKSALRGRADPDSLLRELGRPGLAGGGQFDLDQLLAEARHQADLLRHPYLGAEHVFSAAARLRGELDRYRQLRNDLTEGMPKQPAWRPRGPWSMRRRRGSAATERAHRAAVQRERLGRSETPAMLGPSAMPSSDLRR